MSATMSLTVTEPCISIARKTHLFTEEDIETFSSCYDDILRCVKSDCVKCFVPQMKPEIDWIERVLNENVKESNHFHGLLGYAAYKHFSKENPPAEDCHLAMILGYCAEIGKASKAILDDFNDNVDDRFNPTSQETWHKKVGVTAINDGFLLTAICFRSLNHFFQNRNKSMCQQLTEIVRCYGGRKLLGNVQIRLENKKDLRNILSFEKYRMTSYFKRSATLVLPVLFAVIYTGHGDDGELLKKVENVMIQISHYFQILNDFYSIFGDESTSKGLSTCGKMIRDVLLNSADSLLDRSWLLVIAAQSANIDSESFEFLKQNMATNNAETRTKVKDILRTTGIVEEFRNFKNKLYENLRKNVIDEFDSMDAKRDHASFFLQLIKEINEV